jgi:hypothetical protein
MSDYFITNITGVPTTGSYGPDGKPLNVNNDGGIEITPQNAGNVPSAGTESREGIGNDKSITGNAYNPNASSTDSQSIGPSYPPDQTHYANPQSHSLYKQASISNDKTRWDNYKQDPKNVSELNTYDGYFKINPSDLEEGETTTNFSVFDDEGYVGRRTSSVTVNLGGQTQTSTTTATTTTHTLNTAPRGCGSPSGLVDNPCEMEDCPAGSEYPLGKKMRIFHSDKSCNGRQGYWMQVTNPVTAVRGANWPPEYTYRSPAFDSDGNPIVQDCDDYQGYQRKSIVTGPPREYGREARDCWEEYIETAGGNTLYNPVYRHLLTYLGPDLDNAKWSGWCEYCNQNSPLDVPNSPSQKPCASVSGWQQWFYEGLSCQKNEDGEYERDMNAHSGKLYACCCPGYEGYDRVGRCNAYLPNGLPNPKNFVTLTEVGSTITAGSSDDTCDCLYRKLKGPLFLDEWKGSQGGWPSQYGTDQAVVISGCNQLVAEDQFTNLADNIYIVASGAAFPGGPVWNEDECAWDTPVQVAERCVKHDSPSSYGYCPSGSVLTISDRNLFVGVGHINNKNCDIGCDGSCDPGDITAKFGIGEQIKINSSTPTAYAYSANTWYDPETLNLLASGAEGGLPFQTGCAEEISMCVWYFVGDSPSETGPGEWTLSDEGLCCGCSGTKPSSGLQPDGSYIWIDNQVMSTDCNTGTTGCGIQYCWNVTDRQIGESVGHDIDCTWGYTISFTGNDPSVNCPATGSLSKYILESSLRSGTC